MKPSLKLPFWFVANWLALASFASPVHAETAETPATGTPEQIEFFESRVRPVLVARCGECHASTLAEPKGSLVLDRRTAMVTGGDRGPVLDAADWQKSLLLAAVRYDDVDLQMPPAGKLSADELAAIETWVRDGAAWPSESPPSTETKKKFDLAARKQSHWCWQPIGDPAVPSREQDTWSRGDIDRFIHAAFAANGLLPANDAAAEVWLRRVWFVLVGLPPTIEAMDAFERDSSPQSRERVVDELLASPAFGERWARHWLDLVRYAETYGHEFDYAIPEAHRYRDYVVRALNSDLPYDQFVTEQIAGDLVAPPRYDAATGSDESQTATGFWWLGEQLHAPVDVAGDEAARLDNQIDVLGKTFLGLTLACARCHDHKFDAISQKDVYSLWGFAKSMHRSIGWNDASGTMRATVAALREEYERAVDGNSVSKVQPPPMRQIWQAEGFAFVDRPTRTGDFVVRDGAPGEIQLVPPGAMHSGLLADELPGVLRSEPFTIEHDRIWVRAAGRNARLRLVVDGYWMDEYNGLLFGGLRTTINDDAFRWYEISGDLKRFRGRQVHVELLDDGPGYIAVTEIWHPSDGSPPPDAVEAAPPELSDAQRETLLAARQRLDALSKELTPLAHVLASSEGVGRPQPLYVRGNARTPGEVVHRRFLEAVPTAVDFSNIDGSGRLQLARAICDSANPLTARVMVNRLWHHVFGRGLVASVDNFGVLGELPTHPELLDHLATTFVREGWSIKRALRQMVLSHTFALDSVPSATAVASDPTNRFWSHTMLRRMDGESLRDAMLAIAGRLQAEAAMDDRPSTPVYLTDFMQGRGRPGASGPLDGAGRRSLYLEVRRNFLSPFMLAFDTPIPFSSVGRRATSNVPAQALTMLNDPLVREMANSAGQRVLSSGPSDTPGRIELLTRLVLARRPTDVERAMLGEFIGVESTTGDARHYADAAHVLFNSKAFLFVH